MARWLVAVLMLTGLTLTGPPSHAAVQVTIGASQTVFRATDAVAVRGKAVGAKPGTVVKLQRWVGGTWKTLQSRKTWSAQTYSFSVRLPAGVQYVRVIKPRQLGQPAAASPNLKLTALVITLIADKTTMMADEWLHVSGTTIGARLDSQVNLQVLSSEGVWTTVSHFDERPTRDYSMETRLAPGYQYVRVMMPRQLGQPSVVSPTLRITVRRNPKLVATADFESVWPDRQQISLTGAVTEGPASAVLAMERLDGEVWERLESRAVAAGAEVTFEDTAAPGRQYRLRLLPTTLTTGQTSRIFANTAATYVMTLNSALEIRSIQPTTGAAAQIRVEVAAGERVEVVKRSDVGHSARVYSPSGEVVAGFTEGAARFTARESGTYLIEISDWAREGSLQLWLSTPKVVETTVDDPGFVVDTDRAGQSVEVRIDASATEFFTLLAEATTGETQVLYDGDGTVVKPLLPAVQRYREAVYRSNGGTYTLRIFPSYHEPFDVAVRALSATLLAGNVNGDTVEAVVADPHRVALIEFERPAERVTLGYECEGDCNVEVFDAATGEPSPAGDGRSIVAVSGYDERLPTALVQLTTPLHLDATVGGEPVDIDLTGYYRREVALHFRATQGQVIAARQTHSAGDTYRPELTLAGVTVPNYLRTWRGLWAIPADDEYTMTLTGFRGYTGTLAVETAERLELPGDGTPTTVEIDEPGETIVARIPMPAGVILHATLDEVAASLGDTWDVTLITPDNTYWYNSWAIPGTLPPEVVREPGDILALISADQTGSLRLAFRPRD
ncbi:hypothetical protein [Nocardioides speluncae]|uniref:hypothetical protein n=1 Tax=Nocardioides speluncae TaxID=2670337 RepID=UPI000D69E4FE|nr:hypothetical protein [Nocardioides speluncae]